MREPSRNQTTPATDLHVCPRCDSCLVQPTCWEQAGDRTHWRVWRRCPECEWSCAGRPRRARDRRLRRAARPRRPRAGRRAAGARALEHGRHGRCLRRCPGRRPDRRRRLRLSPALSCSAGRRRRRPGRAAAAVRARSWLPSSRRFAEATISSARDRTWSRAPVAAIRSQSASAAAASRPCRSIARMPGSVAAASISGSVTVPSSRSVPRALPVRSGGPVTSSTSSSSWKARPTSAPKARRCSLVAAEQAGALEQLRRLQPAALQVALLGDAEVEGVVALRQLAAGEGDRGLGEQGDRAGVAGLGEQREGAREEQVAGGDGAGAAGGGGDRRQAAAQRRLVEHVVVDQRRHVDQLDRRRRPHRRRTAGLAGAEQDQHRPQPLAAGRQRRRRVLAERLAVAADRLAQPLLDLAEPGRQPAAGGVEDRRHRRRHAPSAGSPADAAVDRDDPAGEHRVANPLEAGAVHLLRQAGGLGKLRTDSGR